MLISALGLEYYGLDYVISIIPKSLILKIYIFSVIIGAPKANSKFKTTVIKPGSIYQCDQLFNGNPNCNEFLLNEKGEHKIYFLFTKSIYIFQY